MTALPLRLALVAAAVGGMVGSLVRAGLTEAFPTVSGFPWTLFTINVTGSALLAVLPALAAIRRHPWLGVFLGTGVLGGFTTMSAASGETVVLIETGHQALALTYVVGTLVSAVLAVVAVSRMTTPFERATAAQNEVDQ